MYSSTSYLAPSTSESTSSIRFTERIGQGPTSGESQWQRYASYSYCAHWLVGKHGPTSNGPHTAPTQLLVEKGNGLIGNSPHTALIHILDEISLLNVFSLYRPFFVGENEDDDARFAGGALPWVRERWWYKLAHVCKRWRNLIFGSATYLHLSLVCTNGTPVADMLAHSPPLPLIIDYLYQYRDITAEDEEGAILALEQRGRVRRVRLRMPVSSLQKLTVAIDEDYPILEYLVIMPPMEDNSTTLIFPETLQAPHLRHLALVGFALPIGSRLLTTAVGIITLGLIIVHPSTYIHPNTLLRWVLFMPQLETLTIILSFPVPNHHIDRQLSHMPIMNRVTLSNLRRLAFHGVSAYLDAVVSRITTPRLEKLQVGFFNQLTFPSPHLLQFVSITENLRFDSAKFEFSKEQVYVEVYLLREAETYALSVAVHCRHLDWQVNSVAQISNSLSQMFSSVEHLTLTHEERTLSSEEHNEVNRTEWQKLLRSFSNVKTLRIDNGLIEDLSHCLRLDDGELPLSLLPELQELRCDNISGAFTSFVDARQNAGRPVTVTRP